MADVLRQRRAELGMSQVDLAAAAGVDKRQIRRYEAGEQQPVLSVAVAIANALKISVGELAGIPRSSSPHLTPNGSPSSPAAWSATGLPHRGTTSRPSGLSTGGKARSTTSQRHG